MTDAHDTVTIETIPIDRITVLNPRVRDARKFAEIVESIDKVGLKQPIKVSRTTGADGEVAYNLVCGQGRMEAFLALGQTEIPAIVTDLSEQDSLIESLVENIARCQPLPGALFRAIGDLAGLGYSNREIGTRSVIRRHMSKDSGASSRPGRSGCWLPSKPERYRSVLPSPFPTRTTSGRRRFSSRPTKKAS